MEYSIGDRLRIEGTEYDVVGKILYKNKKDNCVWTEYRLFESMTGTERWLSVDTIYNEYSICEPAYGISTDGYHVVDQGIEVVMNAWGNVDVVRGDTARFDEMEDVTEEKIISIEVWEDEREMSAGHYLELADIECISHSQNPNMQEGFQAGKFPQSTVSGFAEKLSKIIVVIAILVTAAGALVPLILSNRNVQIRDYLDETTNLYSYQSSITGTDGEKADVYLASLTLDAAVKDIIEALDGEITDVQQNTDDLDNSVAILTKEEYCLVYESKEGTILVQVSTRKFAYANEEEPYHATRGTRRYYRRFYFSRGYSSDSSTYSDTSSPYSSYDDSTITYNSSDTYSSYASSVRQSSIRNRTSSGGGTSFGK